MDNVDNIILTFRKLHHVTKSQRATQRLLNIEEFILIPQQFTVKAHTALSEGEEGEGGGGRREGGGEGRGKKN